MSERTNNQAVTVLNRDAVTYADIENRELRIQLRTGDVLMSHALLDPIFRRELASKEIQPSDFAHDDGMGLAPEVVAGKLESVGGKGAVIRILGLTLSDLDAPVNGLSLNGDREAVVEKLAFMRDKFRREYRSSKKTSLQSKVLENSPEK